MKKALSIISLTLAVCWLTVLPALAQSPTDYVRGILQDALAIQNNPSLSESQRRPQIHAIIEKSFDFPLMAKDSLGATYNQLSSSQRAEFTNVFSYLFQDSYTRMVLNFLKQENVQYKRESREGSKARVDTAMVRPNETIPVTYLVHSTGQGWIMYDVIVDGVSILQNYKDEFGRVVKTKGFSYLIDRMKTQLQSLR